MRGLGFRPESGCHAYVSIAIRVHSQQLERPGLQFGRLRGQQEPVVGSSRNGGVVQRQCTEVGKKGREAVDRQPVGGVSFVSALAFARSETSAFSTGEFRCAGAPREASANRSAAPQVSFPTSGPSSSRRTTTRPESAKPSPCAKGWKSRTTSSSGDADCQRTPTGTTSSTPPRRADRAEPKRKTKGRAASRQRRTRSHAVITRPPRPNRRSKARIAAETRRFEIAVNIRQDHRDKTLADFGVKRLELFQTVRDIVNPQTWPVGTFPHAVCHWFAAFKEYRPQ